MKKIFTLIGVLLIGAPHIFAQTSGGPDAFGYTWKDSNDPNGPAYSWLNIQDVGVQVNGLTDDNASSTIQMGMDFHYYWYDVSAIRVGSNGWLSFDNTSNIAHCFPTIPVAGGSSDNYLAPFMTDLIMNAAGTNAEVYYWHDSSNDRFVVSYIDVPWWQSASPGYVGLNTFQVILSNTDSSITFQYKEMDQASLADNAGCASDLIIGMENNTGNIGLGLNQFTESVPADNYAIKFYAPAVALIDIPDVSPVWNQTPDNKGFFIESGTDFTLATNIKNVGNADIATDINVSSELENLAFVQVYSSNDVINGLTAGSSSFLSLTPDANVAAGQYYFNTVITNNSDINPGNNSRVTEVNAVDVSQPDVVLSYATQALPDGNVGWTGGGGMGVFIQPPVLPAELTAVDVHLTAGVNGADAFTVEVLAPDGIGGLPGTVLETVNVAANSYTVDAWVNVPLASPVAVSTGGIYLAVHHGADGVFIGTETTGPISRQTYEYVGGSWAVYRENSTVDMLINGHFGFNPPVGVNDAVNENGFSIYPNPTNGMVEIVSQDVIENGIVEVFNSLGQVVLRRDLNQSNRLVLDLQNHTKGIYFVSISNDDTVVTRRVIVR